jgi:hypothetical protein
MGQLHNIIYQIVTSPNFSKQVEGSLHNLNQSYGLSIAESDALQAVIRAVAHPEAWLSVDSMYNLVVRMEDSWPVWVPPPPGA